MRRALALGAAGVLLTQSLAACALTLGGGEESFRILAGSEIQDLEPLLEDARDVIGMPVEVEYTGTLEGAETIASGAAEGEYQAAWFSSDRYLRLLPEAAARTGAAEQTMLSPVVLGVRQSTAERLGWDSTAPSWGDIATAAANGEFTFAMTNPSSSNSGFSALIGVATALSGTGAALTTTDIDAVSGQLADFFSGQTLTAGSSGWLAEEFVAAQGEGTPIDGLVNYESVLLSLNADGSLDEPLTIIYPSDGAVTADYPLIQLSGGDEADQERYDQLVTWLLEPAQQERIARETLRRPVTPGVDAPAAAGDLPIDLPFPGQLEVATGLISAYLNEIRKPPQTVFVLDTSGSMGDENRIEDLRGALAALAGGDPSSSSGFAAFRAREVVTFLPFNTEPGQPQQFTIPASGGDEVRAEISRAATALQAGGDTAIYDSLAEAYGIAGELQEQNPDTYTSIVLMTDGENTIGRELADFESQYTSLPEQARAIRTFTVLFGNSDVAEMTEVAELTGGRVFDARESDLTGVFREIRGYQ